MSTLTLVLIFDCHPGYTGVVFRATIQAEQNHQLLVKADFSVLSARTLCVLVTLCEFGFLPEVPITCIVNIKSQAEVRYRMG